MKRTLALAGVTLALAASPCAAAPLVTVAANSTIAFTVFRDRITRDGSNVTFWFITAVADPRTLNGADYNVTKALLDCTGMRAKSLSVTGYKFDINMPVSTTPETGTEQWIDLVPESNMDAVANYVCHPERPFTPLLDIDETPETSAKRSRKVFESFHH